MNVLAAYFFRREYCCAHPSGLRPIQEVAHKMISAEIIEVLVKLEKYYLIVIDAWRLLPDAEMEELAAYMRALYC